MHRRNRTSTVSRAILPRRRGRGEFVNGMSSPRLRVSAVKEDSYERFAMLPLWGLRRRRSWRTTRTAWRRRCSTRSCARRWRSAASSATPSTIRPPARPTTSTADPSASSPRSTSWAPGRRARTRTWRWMPRSPPTTPGSDAGGRVRHRAGGRLRQDLRGRARRILNLQLDPYYLAPLGLGPMTTAALQASAYMARTGATDRDLADDRGAQPRRRGAQHGRAAAERRQRRRAAAARRGRSSRCARATCRRSARARPACCSRPKARRRSMCKQPAWIQRRRSSRRDADARRARFDPQRQHRAGRREGASRWPGWRRERTSTSSSCWRRSRPRR